MDMVMHMTISSVVGSGQVCRVVWHGRVDIRWSQGGMDYGRAV